MKKISRLADALKKISEASPPGTSFTSTQNVASYIVPIGNPLRREWWKKKKQSKIK